VIGCGNPDAGDDAVGLLAVRGARARLGSLRDVEVVEASTIDLVHLLEDVEGVVVVDAVREPSGLREPGTIVRAEAGPAGLPTDLRSSLSSHGLGVGEAVGLAVALGQRPQVIFLGVEAGDVTMGHGPSARVAGALPELVDRIVEETRRLTRGQSRP
jgi:hydrogenase maturation protease